MGSNWTAVRDTVRTMGAAPSTDGVDEVCSRWDQLLRYGALMLGANLGSDVSVVLSRAHRDLSARLAYLMDRLTKQGLLTGALRVPDTAGDIEVVADLRARQVQVVVEVAAPKDKATVDVSDGWSGSWVMRRNRL